MNPPADFLFLDSLTSFTARLTVLNGSKRPMVALVWGKAATVRSTETVSKVGVLPRRGVTLRSKGDPRARRPVGRMGT